MKLDISFNTLKTFFNETVSPKQLLVIGLAATALTTVLFAGADACGIEKSTVVKSTALVATLGLFKHAVEKKAQQLREQLFYCVSDEDYYGYDESRNTSIFNG